MRRTNAGRRRLGLLVLGAAFLLTGCTSFELTRVRNDLARQMPAAKIGEGYAMSFGRLSIGLARWISGFADEDDEIAQTALREVRRVQFGRYAVNGPVDGRRLVMPARLRRYVERDGWRHLATFRMEDESGWVLYRDRGETVTDLFAVVFTDEELVLAKLSGDLSALVLNVMEQQQTRLPFFREAETPEEESSDQALVKAAASFSG